ncbi:hypothetical protein ACFOW6_12105 [Fodinicurvata halophila]|uniref:OmpA family protein n=1 Tax=Fodinicurvata halophila TaxID=1419723 RepID=A0ABV8ULY2_9PROT
MKIHQQDEAYKRGLVLGLTMAEIVILLLFCLLLALATILLNRRETIEEYESTIEAQAEEIEDIKENQVTDEEREAILKIVRYWEEYGPEDTSASEYFSELVLNIENLNSLEEEITKLAEKRESLERQVSRYQEEIDQRDVLEERLANLERELDRAREELEEKEEELRAETEGHNWPPIIMLKETEGYRFPTGDAELTADFEERLSSSVIPAIERYANEFNVDVIEVIGHTDEQPINRSQSNLDQALLPFLSNESDAKLIAADNPGLGMARAANVARYLLRDGRLGEYEILPISSAQVVDSSGELADGTESGDVPERRRIEIRLRRSQSEDRAQIEIE